MIAEGVSAEDIRADYPEIETEDIQQALAYAAWLTREDLRLASHPQVRLLLEMNMPRRLAEELRARP